MSTLKAAKVLSALPGNLVADMIYFVRVGEGFDLYVTDSTGSITYRPNVGVQTVQITQAAYDALSPPDPDILYVVVG